MEAFDYRSPEEAQTIDRDQLLRAASFVPEFMSFPDAWCGHLPFAAWLIASQRPTRLVELGTHTGNSYLGFCQAVLASEAPTRCHAIDTWLGDEHAGHYGEEVYQVLKSRHDPRYGHFSQLIRSTFDDALARFPDGSVDLLHIDGLHTYDAVRHDFETWLPKMAVGGIVLFHDTQVREREFGVWRYWAELCGQYDAHLEFEQSNGLGVIQIGKPIDQSPLWLRPGSDEQRLIREYFQSLGRSMLERYSARELTARVQFLESEIVAHKAWDERQGLAIAEKDSELANLRQKTEILTRERDGAIWKIGGLKSSRSWRLSAPLRLLGQLLRGNFGAAGQSIRRGLDRIAGRLPTLLLSRAKKWVVATLGLVGVQTNSIQNLAAIDALVDERCVLTRAPLEADVLRPASTVSLPEIDICVVTFNSSRWIEGFVESLLGLNYPVDRLKILFVDNSSTDDTEAKLHAVMPRLLEAGLRAELFRQANLGFGAGHNQAIRKGGAPFCLVTNIDLAFEPDCLRIAASVAVADQSLAAAWELRQKPYEHPKLYDPVTGSTNWNAHACVLLRRSALEHVGGYDQHLFMYGEDVELSYRLRRAGYLLRYCPSAVVWHYSYESSNQIKPLQYTGSTFGNLYIRLKYGAASDIWAVPFMALRLLLSPEVFPGSRRQVAQGLTRLALKLPSVLAARHSSSAHFPFRAWDYDLTREGAFVEQGPLPVEQPLVSIITRTYRGRELYLRQALLSAAHQTWGSTEHIVIEDGGDSMRGLCEEIEQCTGRTIRYLPQQKLGRAACGNAGLRAAKGRWCLFLDDDDLLFADHVEVLARGLIDEPGAVASYSPALEVLTDTRSLATGRYHETAHRVPSALWQEFDFGVLQHHNFMAIQSVLFERRLFLERGGFFEDMDALEDWVLWVRYAAGQRFKYIPRVTSLFRTPADPAQAQRRLADLDSAYPLAQIRVSALVREFSAV